MTIHIGSRYEYAVVDFVAFRSDLHAAPIVFYTFSDIGRVSYHEYTWRTGDRLDNLAMHFYSNPERWWIIPEYNPQIVDFQNIPAGTILKIPNV